MKYTVALTTLALAVGIANSANAESTSYKAGHDYFVLNNPEQIAGDTIIVREFFWYGCPHCYKLDPFMLKWKETKPADVAFFQTPAAMNPTWETNARGFYAAQLMGYAEKTHVPMFEAIQNQGLQLFDKNKIANWYASQGVDKAKFLSLYDSFAVNTRIARSQAAAKRYQLTGVPAVVVQGKYVVRGEGAEVPKVVNFLVNKVRAEQ